MKTKPVKFLRRASTAFGQQIRAALPAHTTTPIVKILGPVNLASESKTALASARALARQSGAQLTLIHVAVPTTYEADYGYGPVTRQIPEKEVKKCQAELDALGRRWSKFDPAVCDDLARTTNIREWGINE